MGIQDHSTCVASEGGSPADESDLDLVRIALEDREGTLGKAAASRLLLRHQRRVYCWCFRYVEDHERALDLSQEVLLRAYRSLETFKGRSQFTSWLFVIARNRCMSELKKPGLLWERSADESLLASHESDPGDALVERLDHEELLAIIREVLDPQEQEVLWLRCFERMPIESITGLLGIREQSGARAVLQRARRKLRAALENRVERERVER